jgi:hypothetical protein
MSQVFEVWYVTKKGEKLLKVSPRQLGIQKNDCFFVEFLERMVDHGLTFVFNPNHILSEIEDSKIAKNEKLFLFENNDKIFTLRAGIESLILKVIKFLKIKIKKYFVPIKKLKGH